jgi:hypothetical protein
MTEFRKEYDSLGEVTFRPTNSGGADPALARTFQHRQGSDPARDGRAALGPCRSRAMQGNAQA